MEDSHTHLSADDTAGDPSSLRLVSASTAGLPEWLAGRVDEHLAVFAAHMIQGLLAASTAVGLEVMGELMDVEVTEVAGPRGKHDPARVAMRHGSEQGMVTLGGRRLGVRRPRVRSTSTDAHEVQLESSTAFASTDLLAEGIVARMLAGLSTRRYPAGLEPVGEQVDAQASGTSKSAVSRRFVAATAERLAGLLARRLDDQRWLVVFLDGFGMGEHLLVGALGVTADGTKVPLGVVEGTTENKAVCTGWLPTWPSGAWTPPTGSCSSSTAARPWSGRSAACSAARRSSNGAVSIRSAMSPTTCPRRSGRWCSAGCAPPGRWATPSRPKPSWSSWPAALTASGPVLPPRCRGAGRDPDRHPAGRRRQAAADRRVDQPHRIDDRDHPRPCRPGEALELGRDGAALGRRRDAGRRGPVPPRQGLPGAAPTRSGTRTRHRRRAWDARPAGRCRHLIVGSVMEAPPKSNGERDSLGSASRRT
jgi:Transposase, Mutator family